MTRRGGHILKNRWSLLAASLALVLAACGGSDADTTTASTPQTGRLRTLSVTEVPSDGAVSVPEARAY